MMDPRAFLARLGFGMVSAAAAALTFDVEKLLWVPEEKAIVLPPRGGNIVLTPSWITREVAVAWNNTISVVAEFNRYDTYEIWPALTTNF